MEEISPKKVETLKAPVTSQHKILWKLFEAWYQQNLFQEQFSVLAGLYDVSSEFDVISSASELFVNSSFGTNPTFAFSGKNGPSIFPNVSLGFRAQAKLTENVTLRAVVADGVPGDPPDDPDTMSLQTAPEGWNPLHH